MNLIHMCEMSSGFKTSKVLVSNNKSPSLIFDQRILKLFKNSKEICNLHKIEWEL